MTTFPETRIHRRRFVGYAVAALASVALVACGKKNSPNAPSKNSPYPKTYPSGAKHSNVAPESNITLATRSD
jgi:hypothetical protein